MKVLVPGKLILSGEHAVVYGEPAIAFAVNRYTTATVTEERLPRVLFHLADLSHRSHFPIERLRDLKSRLKRKYQRFVRGEYSIKQVLQKPFELAQVAMGLFAEAMNISLPHGVKIHVESNIPIGCGMGSSSATILSVMKAISAYLNIPLSSESLFQIALEAENMQHGYSSGLDLRVALQGGGVFVEHQTLTPRTLPIMPWYLVNTGAPLSSTGECVEKVSGLFQDAGLRSAFGHVTRTMDQAILSQNTSSFKESIRANHQLLQRIGVVPDRVNAFVTDLEAASGAAKVCGAGAVSGSAAGVVLAMIDDVASLEKLCERYHYEFFSIEPEQRGVHVL